MKRQPGTQQTLRQRAEAAARESGVDGAGLSKTSLKRLMHELQVHQIELELQNEELRQAQLELAESRDRFSDLYDFAPVGYLTLERNGTIREANLTLAGLLGVNRRQLIGSKFARFVTPAGQDAFHLHRNAVFDSDARQTCELLLRRFDHSTFWVQMESVREPQVGSGALRLRSVLLDVTARHQAQAALRTSEESYRIVAEFTYDWEFWLTPEGSYRYVSPSAERILGRAVPPGISAEALMNLTVHPTDLAARADHLHEELRDHPPCESEYRIVRPDGTVRWVHHVCQAVHDAAGRFLGTRGSNRDITERKEAEQALAQLNATLEEEVVARTQALRQSEADFRGYFENVAVGAAQINAEGRFTRVNDRFCELTGYSRAELLGGMRPTDLDHADDLNADRRSIADCLKGQKYDLEKRYVAKDGRVVWVHVTASAICDPSGQFIRSAAVIEDITARKEAEMALAGSEQYLRAIVETAADGIITLDERGRVESLNAAAAKLFGYAPAEVAGQNLSWLLGISDRSAPADFLQPFEPTGPSQGRGEAREVAARNKSGKPIDLELILTPFVRSQRRRYVAMVHDVTRRKRLERELLLAGERERQQVGQELHDELGQILHGVHFLSSDLESRLKQQGVKEAAELGRIGQCLEEALAATRSLARGLQPVHPVPEGLMNALREHAARVRKLYGLSCRFHCPKAVLVTDSTVATHLFRIAQEAITNAVKHSGCKHIFVQLKRAPGRLILAIRDDGHGRFPAPARRRGMGLHVMQFRARAINGSLAVQRWPRGGTEVTCTVEPLANGSWRAAA